MSTEEDHTIKLESDDIQEHKSEQSENVEEETQAINDTVISTPTNEQEETLQTDQENPEYLISPKSEQPHQEDKANGKEETLQTDPENPEYLISPKNEQPVQEDKANGKEETLQTDQENPEFLMENQKNLQDDQIEEGKNQVLEQLQESAQVTKEKQVDNFDNENKINEIENEYTEKTEIENEYTEKTEIHMKKERVHANEISKGNLSEEIQTDGDFTQDIETNNQSLSPASPNNNMNSNNVSKVLMVNINEEDEQKTIQVEIFDRTYKKPFLGGFKHKLTGIEYLNASCQTFSRKKLPSKVEKFSRDTQTVKTRNYTQQTFNNTSTQMTKTGCYITDVTDVTRTPGKYVTAEEEEELRLKMVVILQSYCRRWLASQYVKKVRCDRETRLQWEQAQAEQKAAERAERLRKEFERRMKPKSKADFDLLYAALEKWRKEELNRINANSFGNERKAALVGLLEQETFMIQSIERHKINADQINQEELIRQTLEKAALPVFWRAYDGKLTEMNTQHTLRAQELKDIYNSLHMNYLANDERLDVLLTLKHTVKVHDCKLTQELIELIDREADLLGRKLKSANLEGLRQRISTLFLQYCKTPLFNPEIGRLLKVPQDPAKLQKDIYFCPSCNSYRPSTEFPLASNSRIVGRCKRCASLDNNARLRHDFTKIRFILQHLRRTEEAFNDNSKIAFVIQDADLRYLIENIWNAQSAISGIDDLYELVMIRWKKLEQWSPWNCVLLTKDEASAHMKLENISEAYGRIFIGKVRHRHVLAKQYFSKLTKVTSNQKLAIGERSKPSNKFAATVTS